MTHGEKEKKFISIRDASNFSGLDPQTIRKLFDNQTITGYKTPSGQRKINNESIQTMCSSLLCNETKQSNEKKNFLYTRVSTKKQLDDLSRQIEFIRQSEYSEYTLISDIGSGINFKRKGLSTILDSCLQGDIGEIIVAHRDRLCRFGFELIESIVTKAGGSIKVLNDNKQSSPQTELADDLLAIIHIFSCRQMGRRTYSTKRPKKSKDFDDKIRIDSETTVSL